MPQSSPKSATHSNGILGRLTDPMVARTSPLTMVHRLPKISGRGSAIEKLTEDAMDQPPTIQLMFSVSPRSVLTGTRIPVIRTKPHEIGQT